MKNIEINIKTESGGYETLYPKVNAVSSNVSTEVSQQFGLENGSIDDVLKYLGKFNEYWWSEQDSEKIVHWEIEEKFIYGDTDTTLLFAYITASEDVELKYSDNIQINQRTGQIELVNPILITLSISDYKEKLSEFKDKYIVIVKNNSYLAETSNKELSYNTVYKLDSTRTGGDIEFENSFFYNSTSNGIYVKGWFISFFNAYCDTINVIKGDKNFLQVLQNESPFTKYVNYHIYYDKTIEKSGYLERNNVSNPSEIYYSQNVSFDNEGKISLIDKITIPKTTSIVNYYPILGKFLQMPDDTDTSNGFIPAGIYYVPTTSTLSISSKNISISLVYPLQVIKEKENIIESYNIPYINAVTATRIQLGIYTGNGLKGADNKNSLAFDFVPKMVYITHASDSSSAHGITSWEFKWEYNKPDGYVLIGSVNSINDYALAELNEKTLYWWTAVKNTSTSESYQMNNLNSVYAYVAFG